MNDAQQSRVELSIFPPYLNVAMKTPDFSLLLLGACLATGMWMSGCASRSDRRHDVAAQAEAFDASTFSRSYMVPPLHSCEAARRALLSQGYVIHRADGEVIGGSKSFLKNREEQYLIEFTVTCLADQAGSSTVFVSAMQQLYSLKKTNTSASVGVSVLGSLSVPIAAADDSLVKVGSVTITAASLYEQFFNQLEAYLPVAVQDGADAPAQKDGP